jgi:hypothetical protein
MRQTRPFPDERHGMYCAVCGAHPQNREHAPPKILLDRPFPETLPIVQTCRECNEGHSMDEEHVAFLVESARLGVTSPAQVERPDVRRVQYDRPALAARLKSAHSDSIFSVEHDRVVWVILELSRCHAAYDLAETCLLKPVEAWALPLCSMRVAERDKFEAVSQSVICLELGSRAMQRSIDAFNAPHQAWVTVPPNRYRFLASISDAVQVRIELSDYLAAKVVNGLQCVQSIAADLAKRWGNGGNGIAPLLSTSGAAQKSGRQWEWT